MAGKKKDATTDDRLDALEGTVAGVDGRIGKHEDREEKRHDALDRSIAGLHEDAADIKDGLRAHVKDFKDHVADEAAERKETQKENQEAHREIAASVDRVRALLNKYAISTLATIILALLFPFIAWLLIDRFS